MLPCGVFCVCPCDRGRVLPTVCTCRLWCNVPCGFVRLNGWPIAVMDADHPPKPETGSFGINYRRLTAFRPYGLFRIVVPSPDDNLDNAQSFYGSTSPSFRRPLLFSLCCRSAFPFPGRKFRISSSFSFRSGCCYVFLTPILLLFFLMSSLFYNKNYLTLFFSCVIM